MPVAPTNFWCVFTISVPLVRSKLNENSELHKSSITQEVRRYTIASYEAGQRLDNFVLKLMKGVPKTHVYRLIRKGQVRVNGGRKQVGYRLNTSDIVRLPPVRAPESHVGLGALPTVARLIDSSVLYQDRDLLILNKPSGIAVHGGSGLHGGLIESLRHLRNEPQLELAHRIDRDTSGCLLIARRRSALRELHAAFRHSEVVKVYMAIVVGKFEEPFEVRAPLLRYRSRGGERHVVVSDAGQSARTRFEPLTNHSGLTWARIDLGTGRTHQIRVHAAHSGIPVAGDERYGIKDVNRDLRRYGLVRLALHAYQLRFVHPATEKLIEIKAPLPEMLESFSNQYGLAVPTLM